MKHLHALYIAYGKADQPTRQRVVQAILKETNSPEFVLSVIADILEAVQQDIAAETDARLQAIANLTGETRRD